MQIDDSVNLLTTYEAHGSVPSGVASEVMSRLLLLAAYPENIVIPGGTEFALLKVRYGEAVMNKLMWHLNEALAMRRAITDLDFAFDESLPIAVQQDKNVLNLLYTMYFKMWTNMRATNFEHFPYVFANTGASAALFTQLRGDKLLEYAGI